MQNTIMRRYDSKDRRDSGSKPKPKTPRPQAPKPGDGTRSEEGGKKRPKKDKT